MTQSTNLDLTYLDLTQPENAAYTNNALATLDILVQTVVENATTLTPPTNPVDGVAYIVPVGANSAWSGQDGNIAACQDAAWVFITPEAGYRLYNKANARLELYNGAQWNPVSGSLDTCVYSGDDGFAFADTQGGIFAQIGPDKVVMQGVETSSYGTAKLSFLTLCEESAGADESLELDALGGIIRADRAGETYTGGQYQTESYTLSRSGALLSAAPLAKWVGLGVDDAPLSDSHTTAFPVKCLCGYAFPTITDDRYKRTDFDLAVMQAPIIPAIACWPSGRIIRANMGKSGVAPGDTGEGKGSYVRLSVREGEHWRHVRYIIPTDWNTEAVVDPFIKRLSDNRALIVFPHDGNSGANFATAVILVNPQDDPELWEFGPMCNIGRGFPSYVTELDNGELVGAVWHIGLGASAPYADPLFGNRFGYYTIDDDHAVSFTEVGIIPPVEPGATFNSFQETSIIQTGSNALFALFRTRDGYYYSTSTDRGVNWSTSNKYTNIPTIDSKVFIARMPDGRLLALCNADADSRRDMTLYLSDIGASPLDAFPYSWLMDERTWVSYPSADAHTDDRGQYRGEISIVYDRGRNTTPDSDGGYIADLLFVHRFNIHALMKGFYNFKIEETQL